ncbi:hypothetical protein [Sphingomonas quercus]|uniref:DUF962 domain-containing protein n=1 Tax=Sphingomonas quercus TaxID=2842451 RepID=A0ABS6BPS5_9SPHN|nr:hypothetical protein [Sphingomonas quercus]MBU3079210.1 hypothetical protein [Sphingomonas quercus]
MSSFREQLREQRWDDHRFYHHSLINQSLHLLSACTFLACYGLLFVDPAAAALIAWTVSMTSRQAGHFFFEPRGYDNVNGVTHRFKEEVKVGYNLVRKLVLTLFWAAAPLLLLAAPALFGLLEARPGVAGFLHNLGLIWLVLGCAALVFRMVQLFFIRDVMTGIVWATKILTDPFHDISLYWRAPARLMRGERLGHGFVAASR